LESRIRRLGRVAWAGVQIARRDCLVKEDGKARPVISFEAFGGDVEGSVDLADDSGGVIIQNTNDFEKGLARVLDAMRTYYIIGYEAPPHAKQGFHKIEVQVRTKGLNVRARRGYFDVTGR
jgi:hypothetical protein